MPDLHALIRRLRRLISRFRRPLSALLAAIAVLAVLETMTPAEPASRPVVVAAHDLSAGLVLSAADMRVVRMPPDLVPDGSSSSGSPVVGHVLAGPLRAGEALTDQRIVGRSLLAGYPPGLVGAPIRIHDAAVVELLEVGERIDVYAARHATSYADRVVSGVRVVTLPRPADDNEEGALIVLAVTRDQAAALAQASALAPLSLTLLR